MPPKSQSPPGHPHDNNPDSQYLDLDNCQCHETGKCVCALKTEVTEPPSGFSMPPPPAARRPRLYQSQSSEHHMTVFANGHHKPVHRNNHAAHECGVPYRIPNFHPAALPFPATAHRSTESLPTLESLEREAAIPQTPSIFASFSTERRMSKSEQTSPLLRPFRNTLLLDEPGLASQPASASLDVPYLNGSSTEPPLTPWIDTNLSGQDSDVGLLSATSLGPDVWSWTGNDLPIGSRNRSESDPLSWANGNNSVPTQPALTHASSSGPQSEVGDTFGFDDAVLTQQLNGPPSAGSQSAAAVEPNVWDNFNLAEPANNRWSMPSFPATQPSPLSASNSTFQDYQKESFNNEMNVSLSNGRSVSSEQPSLPLNSITSQPRSSSSFTVFGNPTSQASLDNSNNLSSTTDDWLKELGLNYEVNESEIFGTNMKNPLLNNSIDNADNMPVGNTLSVSAGDDDFNSAALLPTTATKKSVYAQPHGIPSWNNSSTNLGDVTDTWLR